MNALVLSGSATLMVRSDPDFFLEFEGPDSLAGPPGSRFDQIYLSLLRNVRHEYNVVRWETSMAVENAEITSITLLGTDAEPAMAQFQELHLADEIWRQVNECEGLHGAVTAVDLEPWPASPVELPSPGTASIAALTVAVTIPDEVSTARLTYADGCSSDVLDNQEDIATLYGGIDLRPYKGSLEIQIVPATGNLFQRGDSNSDDVIDISDSVYTLGFLFLGGPTASCRRAADTNGDSSVDLSDAVYGLSFLFLGGSPPPYPNPRRGCGHDPTPDGLSCDSYPPCN